MQNTYILWLINLLSIWGVYAAFKPGMIFGELGDKIEDKLGDYWSKPVIGCPICMPSLWGVPVYLTFSLSNQIEHEWYLFPVYLLSMSGMNYIISQLISKEVDVNINK